MRSVWTEIGSDRYGNQKLSYRILKSMRNGNKNTFKYMKDKGGNIIKNIFFK